MTSPPSGCGSDNMAVRESLFSARLQELVGQKIHGVSVTSDDNGVSCVHVLADNGHAFRIRCSDRDEYLHISEYTGWVLRG